MATGTGAKNAPLLQSNGLPIGYVGKEKKKKRKKVTQQIRLQSNGLPVVDSFSNMSRDEVEKIQNSPWEFKEPIGFARRELLLDSRRTRGFDY